MIILLISILIVWLIYVSWIFSRLKDKKDKVEDSKYLNLAKASQLFEDEISRRYGNYKEGKYNKVSNSQNLHNQ